MNLRRVRHGEWIAGISGIVLLVAMFFDWYSAAGGSANAWEAFSVNDVILALAALMGIALLVASASQRTPAVPQATGGLTVPVAFIASILVIVRALSLPGAAAGREAGLYVGIVATLGVLVGAWRSIGDESFPAGATPRVEVTPLPAPKTRSAPQQDE